jgi:hypothetical protein
VSGPIDATAAINLSCNAREFLAQRYEGRCIVGIREPLLVGGETPHVVRLEEKLTGTNGVAGSLPGQLEQAEAVHFMVFPHYIEGELEADLKVV